MKKLIFLLSILVSFSCSTPTEKAPAVDVDQLVADITTMSNDFQSAYVTRDWDTASTVSYTHLTLPTSPKV